METSKKIFICDNPRDLMMDPDTFVDCTKCYTDLSNQDGNGIANSTNDLLSWDSRETK
jgi:hypothetical protein